MPSQYPWLMLLGICVVVISVTVIYIHRQRIKHKEGFQAIHDGQAQSGEADANTAPTITCNVMQVPREYHNACNNYLFQKSTPWLEYEKKTRMAGENPADVDRVLYTRKCNPQTDSRCIKPKGLTGVGCMVPFGQRGYLGNVAKDATDLATLEARNDKDEYGRATDISSSWAFCYRPVEGAEQAKQVYDEIGNRGAFQAYDQPLTIAGDTYSRITLNTLKYDSLQKGYCALPPPSNYTSDKVYLGIKVSDNLRIQDVGVYYYIDNVIHKYHDPVSVYKLLFKIETRNNRIVYAPQQVVARSSRFEIDICDRIDYEDKESIDFSVSSLGIQEKVIMTIPQGMPGDLAGLETYRDSLNAQYEKAVGNLESLRQQKQEAMAQTNLAAGLLLITYDLPSSLQQRNYWFGPDANNAAQMDTIFKTKVTNPRNTYTENYHFNTAQDDMKAYEFIGLLKVTRAGHYKFKIATDDAGQLFVGEISPSNDPNKKADRLVATHYHYHGPDWNGISLDNTAARTQGFYLPVGNHKLYSRFIEWHGGEGQYLYWRRVEDGTAFVQIPRDNLLSNRGANASRFDGPIQRASVNVNTILNNINQVEAFINALTASSSEYALQLMNQIKGKQLPEVYSILISQDNTLYLNVGQPPFVDIANHTNNTNKQPIIENVRDITTQYQTLDPPLGIRYTQPPTYTMAMWMKVARPHNHWRNVVFHGDYDDWRNWWYKEEGKVDRTPGIWIYPVTGESWNGGSPNDQRIRIHVRHRVSSNVKAHYAFNWGTDVWGPANACDVCPKYNEWFHFATVVTPKSMKNYINGKLVTHWDFNNNNQGHQFEWNYKQFKKFYIGMHNQHRNYWKVTNGPLLVQKLYWYNRALSNQEISNLAKAPIAMGPQLTAPVSNQTPNTLRALYDNVVVGSGTYTIRIDNRGYPVYVEVLGDGSMWALILNYVHKGGTNPDLFVRTLADGFPLFTSKNLGDDGSKTVDSWGHLGNAFMSKLDFTSMRFYGKTSNNHLRNGRGQVADTIHFRTSDPTVISYAKTGRGQFRDRFAYTLYSDHTATIPQDSRNRFANQGDYALTEFPFWKGGENHWGIRGGRSWGYAWRWEVNDFPEARPRVGGHMFNTIHQVWVGFNTGNTAPSNCTLSEGSLYKGSTATVYKMEDGKLRAYTSPAAVVKDTGVTNWGVLVQNVPNTEINKCLIGSPIS